MTPDLEAWQEASRLFAKAGYPNQLAEGSRGPFLYGTLPDRPSEDEDEEDASRTPDLAFRFLASIDSAVTSYRWALVRSSRGSLLVCCGWLKQDCSCCVDGLGALSLDDGLRVLLAEDRAARARGADP